MTYFQQLHMLHIPSCVVAVQEMHAVVSNHSKTQDLSELVCRSGALHTTSMKQGGRPGQQPGRAFPGLARYSHCSRKKRRRMDGQMQMVRAGTQITGNNCCGTKMLMMLSRNSKECNDW